MTDQNDFIKLLFDTLETATKDNSSTVKELVNQQMNLVSTVEKMPIGDIRQDLKDHVTAAHDERKSILEKVNELSGKVKLMIGVVAAAVAFTGVVYVVGRFLIDYHIPKQEMATVQKKLEKQQKHDHQELIDAVRKEIKKLHPDADKQEKVR